MPVLLIVDDDLDLAAVMRDCLEASGYTVNCAPNVDEAKSFMLEEDYDLLVLDWDMPGTSGVDFCKHLSFYGFTKPILMVTGHSSEDDMDLSIDCGADDYLTKPFKVKELLARVKSLLRRIDAYQFKLGSGVRFNNLELKSEIGAGGMGSVWEAYDSENKRDVAVKFLSEALVKEGTFWERFQLEAKTLEKLEHKNIVRLFDYGLTPGKQPYIVMELLDGINLVQLLNAECTSISQIVEYSIQVCEGLAYMHEHGVIHRDLKPSNVMIMTKKNERPLVKLVDFGLVKPIKKSYSPGRELTEYGNFYGTAWYMSPEQGFSGELDHRSDIYSFGCLLYILLGFEPPFDGEDSFAIMQKHMTEQVQPLRVRFPEFKIPEALDNIVFNCLQKLPEHRYQSVNELITALRLLSDLDEIKQSTEQGTPL